MGFLLTLPKEYNLVYTDFPRAYWSIDNIMYTPDMVQFTLNCYPSREAKYKNFTSIEKLDFGSPLNGVYETNIYAWHAVYPLKDVFPNGIPVDTDEQKKILYQFLRTINASPFKDVFEEED